MPYISICSVQFPNCYLRLDGTNVTSGSSTGGGTVNAQCLTDAGSIETLKITNVTGGSDDIFTIASTTFANVVLRMDAGSNQSFNSSGFGTVNCQYNAGAYEQFRFVQQSDETTAIESVQFPGTYLRMDATGVTLGGSPGGRVNCQNSVGAYEKFIIGDFNPAPLTKSELVAAIANYGPLLKLHPTEPYVNTSIDYFLQYATLRNKTDSTTIVHPTSDQLPQGGDGKTYYLTLEDAGKAGDFSQAKAYVNAVWLEGQTCTDIQFWVFSAYNGPGTAHVNGLVFDTIAHTGEVDLSPMGEHYGDWECIMIRVDNNTKNMMNVWLSQHSGGRMVEQKDISQVFRMDRNTHPIVYSSRNGHANYPSPSSNYTEHHKVPPVGIPAGVEFFLRNDTADSSGQKQLDCSATYELISASWLTGDDAVAVPKWVTYPYRWGPEGTTTSLNSNTVANIVKAAAGPLAPFLPFSSLVVVAGLILPMFIKDDLNGPSGPITKSTWIGNY